MGYPGSVRKPDSQYCIDACSVTTEWCNATDGLNAALESGKISRDEFGVQKREVTARMEDGLTAAHRAFLDRCG
jgi:hypothetical protein